MYLSRLFLSVLHGKAVRSSWIRLKFVNEQLISPEMILLTTQSLTLKAAMVTIKSTYWLLRWWRFLCTWRFFLRRNLLSHKSHWKLSSSLCVACGWDNDKINVIKSTQGRAHHVSHEIRFLHESHLANAALVLLLSTVDLHMAVDRIPSELLQAERTVDIAFTSWRMDWWRVFLDFRCRNFCDLLGRRSGRKILGRIALV